ncbi:MAG: PKD domain-containing protein [Bacteroidales bacterium]
MKNINLKVIPWLLRFCVILQLQFAYGQNITKAEYFYDTEPGIGMGIPIPGFIADTTSGFTFTANVSGLDAGYHYLYVRVMDSLNIWSVVSNQFFLINPLETQQITNNISFQLSKAEYFIDTDPGVENGISMFMLSGDTLNQTYTINIAQLALGNHIIGVRVKDITGNWSVTETKVFIIKNTACSSPNAFFAADTVNASNLTHFTNLSTNINSGTSYLWKIIKPNETITGTTKDFSYTFDNPGYYDVILKVSNSDTCTSFWQQKVIVGPVLSKLITITGSLTFCNGDSVLLLAPAGSNYQWSNGNTTQQITVKTSGVYQVIYKDTYSYGAVSNQISVKVNPVLDLTVDVSPANNSLSNGSAFAIVNGGSSYIYNYTWSTGEHTMMATGLAPGNYSISVSDGICPITKNYTVNNISDNPHGIVKAEYYIDNINLPPHSLTINFNDTINSFCNVPLTGIIAGYHYLYVRVLDSLGLWSFTNSVLFTIDSIISPPIDTGYNLVKAEYFYDDVDPGIYKATSLALQANSLDVLDQNIPIVVSDTLAQGFHYINLRTFDRRYGWGVIERNLFYINPPTDIFPLQQHANFGLIDAEYFYDNDPGIGNGKPLFVIPADSINMTYTTDLTGLSAGIHKIFIRIKDLVGKWSVVSSASFTIVSPIACTPPIPEFTYTSATAGQAVIFTNTSTQLNDSSTYKWDMNNDTIAEYTTLNCSHTFPVSGIYPIKLTINNGGNCISSVIHYITIGTQLSNLITANGPTEFCNGGSVTLTAPSGSNYQWTCGDTSQSIIVGIAGIYQLTYTDLNGINRLSDMLEVKVNPLMNITVAVDDASNGLSNGSASANVSGGNSWSYQYQYSTGETLQTAVNLAPGGYSVFINDGKCPETKAFTVNNIANVNSGIMYGEYYIDTIPELGLSHYFTFGQGDTINSNFHIPLTGLSIGLHFIYIRIKESTGLWSIPMNLTFFVTDSITPPDTTTRNITAIEYFFDNNDPGPGNGIQIPLPIPASVIDYNFNVPTLGLSSGFHYVSVRTKDDKNYWSTILLNSIFYVRPDTICPQIENLETSIILAEYFIDHDPGQGNGITVPITPGFTIDQNFSVNTSALDTGIHYICIRVKNLNNIWSVINSKTIHIIPQNGCLTPNVDFTFNQANAGDVVSFTNLSVNTNPNTEYYWYISNNINADFNTINASYIYSTPGIYNVRLMANNGSNCQSTVIKQINIGPLLSNSITANGNLEFCIGDSVTLTAPSGSNYFWSNGDTNSSITVTSSGIYHVVYTDIYGIIKVSEPIEVIVHPNMIITTSVGFANSGLANGSASVAVSGGNSYVYTYLWSTASTLSSITGVYTGTYTVNISDGVCFVNKSLSIPELPENLSKIIAAEYFFDNDPGCGLGTSVLTSMGDSINISVNASTSGLSAGIHTFLLRIKESSGTWSIVGNQQVYIYPPEIISLPDTLPYIVAAEYFLNSDPGIGNGIPIMINNPSTTLDINTIISIQGASFGSNIIGLRVKDSNKKWSDVNSTNFMMCTPPSNPIAANDTIVCQGSTLTLKASNVNGATYEWSGPNGFTSLLQNPVIIADTGKSGYYKVYTLNGGNCYSKPDSMKVEVKITPAKPGFITGPIDACLNDTVVFYVPMLTGATSYVWDFPVPHTILAGFNTNTIAVRFDTTLATIPIKVRGLSSCGYGPYSETFYLILNSQLPQPAGVISGSSTVCQGADTVLYTTPAINNATTYIWSLPAGASIVSGNGSNAIRVHFSTNAVSGNIQVFGRNSCSDGLASNIHVTINTTPYVTQGSYSNLCANSSPYTLTTGIPSGGIFSGIGIQNGIFDPLVSGIGTHTVLYTYTNAFNCSNTSTSTITVLPLISQSGAISGPANVCQNSIGNVYFADPITDATSYTWTLPNGYSGQSNTNTILVSINTIATNGQIKVKGNNYCGSGPESTFNIIVNTAPLITQQAVSQTRCGNGSLSFNAISSAGSNLQWSLDNFMNIAGTGNLFTIPSVQTTNPVVVYYKAVNSLSGCESAVYTVTGTAYQTPIISSFTADTICGAGSIQLSANASVGNINWYNQSTGGVLLSSASSYSTTISATTTYYAEAINNSCKSTPRIAITAVVKSIPSIQANAFTTSAISNSSMTIAWTRGNGDSVLVIAKQGSAVNISPISNVYYTANTNFGNGTALGNGNFIVYKGIGTSANITGLLAVTTYHFAVFEYNSNSSCYKTPGLLGLATTFSSYSTFTAAISNAWETAANWNHGVPSAETFATIAATKLAIVNSNNYKCKNLTIAPLGKLTINAGKDLTVKDSLVLKSDASGTASLIDNGTLFSSTNIVERYIPHTFTDEFHMLSSPVVSQAISPVFNEPDGFFVWNEATGNWVDFADATNFAATNGNSNFIPAKGYAVSYPTATTKSFTGILNTGTINIPLSVTAGLYSGWNFIANPYPSAINWNASSGWNRSVLENADPINHPNEKAIWVWNAQAANYGAFISNTDAATNGVSRNIALSQGFWVKATSAGSLAMNNEVREHADQAFLKSSTMDEMIRLKVTSAGNTYSDELIVSFGNISNQGGAEKMFSIEASAPSIYSCKLNKKWSISNLTSIADNATIPVGFKTGVDGNYTISAMGVQTLGNVMLEDLNTGVQQNLSINNNYSFNAQTNDNENRFLLHFGAIGIKEIVTKNPNIYFNNEIISVFNPWSGKTTLNVYDINGKLIQTYTAKEGNSNYPFNPSKGVYVIKLQNEQHVFVKKEVVY